MFSCCRAVHDGCGIGVCVVLNMPTDSRTGTPRGPASEEGCVCAEWYLRRELVSFLRTSESARRCRRCRAAARKSLCRRSRGILSMAGFGCTDDPTYPASGEVPYGYEGTICSWWGSHDLPHPCDVLTLATFGCPGCAGLATYTEEMVNILLSRCPIACKVEQSRNCPPVPHERSNARHSTEYPLLTSPIHRVFTAVCAARCATGSTPSAASEVTTAEPAAVAPSTPLLASSAATPRSAPTANASAFSAFTTSTSEAALGCRATRAALCSPTRPRVWALVHRAAACGVAAHAKLLDAPRLKLPGQAPKRAPPGHGSWRHEDGSGSAFGQHERGFARGASPRKEEAAREAA